jgi:prepilin-type N-terminal cleavage/methylation domain-containing protein
MKREPGRYENARMKQKGFTLIELLILVVIIAVVVGVVLTRERPGPLYGARVLGGMRGYLNAQAIYVTKYKTYGALDQLQTTGLDSLVAKTTIEKEPFVLYAGYWFTDEFTGLNRKFEYQCVATPGDSRLPPFIILTNESGNIYYREASTLLPDHGITGKVPQFELDDTAKWKRSEG